MTPYSGSGSVTMTVSLLPLIGAMTAKGRRPATCRRTCCCPGEAMTADKTTLIAGQILALLPLEGAMTAGGYDIASSGRSCSCCPREGR